MKTVLTIAGSDSGGGAGVQADLKTFCAFKVHGASAITAITVQNTQGVQAVHPVEPQAVADQIEAVLSDLGADAVKIGMLQSAAIAGAVAKVLQKYKPPHLVVDPVLLSSSGMPLLDDEGCRVLIDEILPLCEVVTPNLPEAGKIIGLSSDHPDRMEKIDNPERMDNIDTPDRMAEAARCLIAMGPRCAIIKGGHLAGDPLDLLYDGTNFMELINPRIPTAHTHGTGCTFSSALAACLALGADVGSAFKTAVSYVHQAIRNAPGLGRGIGPLDHTVSPNLTFDRNDRQ